MINRIFHNHLLPVLIQCKWVTGLKTSSKGFGCHGQHLFEDMLITQSVQGCRMQQNRKCFLFYESVDVQCIQLHSRDLFLFLKKRAVICGGVLNVHLYIRNSSERLLSSVVWASLCIKIQRLKHD